MMNKRPRIFLVAGDLLLPSELLVLVAVLDEDPFPGLNSNLHSSSRLSSSPPSSVTVMGGQEKPSGVSVSVTVIVVVVDV